MEEKYLCWRCRELTKYHIEQKKRYFGVEDRIYPYIYKYGICDKCGEEIYIPGLDDENSASLDKAIKEKNNVT